MLTAYQRSVNIYILDSMVCTGWYYQLSHATILLLLFPTKAAAMKATLFEDVIISNGSGISCRYFLTTFIIISQDGLFVNGENKGF